jgi:PPOX class probable F420-dependent enzyme
VIELPEGVRATLQDRSFWQLATINPDGSPTATPVWADLDGDFVVVNTAVGRLKERNARRDPRVALAMVTLSDPYAWVEIRGRVIEFIEGEEAERSIQRLAAKYLGGPHTHGADERRVILRIEPTSVNYRTESGSERHAPAPPGADR